MCYEPNQDDIADAEAGDLDADLRRRARLANAGLRALRIVRDETPELEAAIDGLLEEINR